jgi:hypothetical protein
MAEINARDRRTRKRGQLPCPTLPKRRPASRRWLPMSYCKSSGNRGCRAIVVDASVGADTTMRVALPAVPL